MAFSFPISLSSIPSRILRLLQIFLVGSCLYFFVQPQGLSSQGWHLFVIFACTIVAIILKPFPMGALAIVAVCVALVSKTISLATVLNGFANDLIWLILMACFLARAFIKTGLGKRIAFALISRIGGNPMGLSYSLLGSAFLMAPLIPSAAARSGGIILPVLNSLIAAINKTTKDGKHIAEFLLMTVLHGTVITSALFITANVSNPIAVRLAKDFNADITWCSWAAAAFLPGIVSLVFLPPLLYFLLPARIQNRKNIIVVAKNELAAMGPVSKQEKITLSVFVLLLILWSCSAFFHMQPTEGAIIGVALLLLFEVLSWHDIATEELAWDTFFWVAILVMLAGELQALGVVKYFTTKMTPLIPCGNWPIALIAICLVYFYSHYLFASNTAHLSSMYGPFLAMACTSGAPPLLAALVLGFLSSLFGGLTHYSSSSAPILFSQNHVSLRSWWKIGFILSIYYLVIWFGVGLLWWHWLGIY